MPILIAWDDETHQVMTVRYQGVYTWDDLDRVVDQIYAMLRSVPHRVTLIAIMDRHAKSPGGSNMIARFRRIIEGMPDNLEMYINVGRGNALTNALFNAIMKIYPIRFRTKMVATEAEAHKIIASLSV